MGNNVAKLLMSIRETRGTVFYQVVLLTPFRVEEIEVRRAEAQGEYPWKAMIRFAELIQEAVEANYSVEARDGIVIVADPEINPPRESFLNN